MNEIIFKSDTAERKRFFKAASFAHPAKMVLGLQIYLIEHYTKPGDTILDPMAGSGTILIACTLSRNVVLVELEEKFCKMQQDNYQKIRSLGPMLGYQMGEAVILQGDARNLSGVLADEILFSPPYAEAQKSWSEKSIAIKGHYKKGKIQAYTPEQSGESEGQIANLPYGEISAIVSSPPYEGTVSGKELDESEKLVERLIKRKSGKNKGKPIALGRSQLTKYADAIVTSPPYEGINTTGKANSYNGSHGPHSQVQIQDYRHSQENIGNLKSDNYLEAMLAVYRQCRVILKPEGVMVLVTKNFIRDKKIIRLDLDTIKLCEQAGFKLKERLKRKLTAQSFWRTIYYKKFPEVEKIEFEDVLIFGETK